jgi:energy-coupling factor transporter ATP-binding protein EcfA2
MPGDAPITVIARFLRALFRPGDVFEVRAPKCADKPGSTYRSTASGYYTFDSIDKAATDIAALDNKGVAPGIYVTLNPVRSDLLARAFNRVERKAGATTADPDVRCRRKLLIDLDPRRPSDVSATDSELALAHALAEQIMAALRALGWREPIRLNSGNGVHLIYEIDLPTDDGGLVENLLEALGTKFDTDAVKVDRGVFNASRISKIPGTMARKGDDLRGVPAVEDRPHRRAEIVSIPEQMVPLPRELMEAFVAEHGPKTPGPKAAANRAPQSRPASGKFAQFDHSPEGVRDYLEQHGVEIKGEGRKDDATVLYLARCPVNPECVSTSGTDIAVFVGDDGEIGYSNLHSRGAGLHWRDVREALEPGYADFAGESEDDDGKGPAQKDVIVAMAHETYRFGRTEADEPFAVKVNGPQLARMLRGGRSALKAELAREFYRKTGSAPGSGPMSDALLVLEGEALAANPEQLDLRLGRHEDAIIIDLGNAHGTAVALRPTGWEVLDRSPIVFRRSPLVAPLPVPTRGGSIDRLREFVNVSAESWPLALGWLVAALIPDIEHAIVLLGGQQDSGKSTTGRCLAGVVDPSTAPLRTAPRDVEEWAVAAVGSWVVVIDNISGIAEWLSDAFCRAVTGDGLVRRALYTDDALSVLVFQRCLILTSIDAGGLKGDLGRRLIILDLEPIGRRKKRPPRALRWEFAAALPGIFGALLDLAARVLVKLPDTKLEDFVGLADFEQVLAAMDAVEGTETLTQYRAQWARIAADVVEDDAVAEAVRSFATEHCQLGLWIGTASEMLKLLTVPTPRPKDWPKGGKALGGRLRRLIPVLAAVGIEVVAPRPKEKGRKFSIALIAQPPENGSAECPNGGSGRAIAGSRSPKGPGDSPTENPPGGSADADFGRSGDSGDPSQPSIPDDGWGEVGP